MAMDNTSNMQNSNAPLTPTFIGHIASTLDALILFEACLSSHAFHVARRPHDRERQELIKSGHVFIYEEHSSGIKRWTDGVAWSPSRILGNFLIYRELDRPFPPGEKKRATKRIKKGTGVNKSDGGSRQGAANASGQGMGTSPGIEGAGQGKESERSLIGSLVDSYPFKEGGLVKKTISVTYNGVPHHLVSYYNLTDVHEGKLLTPTKAANLAGIMPRSELIMSQNFRAPIDEVEYNPDERGQGLFSPVHGGPGMTLHGGMIHRTMSLPNVQAVHLGQFTNPSPFSIQSHVPQYINNVSNGVGNVGYMPQALPHYSYEGQRPSRYGPSAGLGADLSRTLPLSPARRHSTAYETTAADLSLTSLPAIPESRSLVSNAYMTPSYYHPQRVSDNAPHENGFPSPRDIHADPVGLGGERSSHALGFDEMGRDAGSWSSFDGMETGQNQYLGGSNSQWTPSASSLGRA